MQQTDVYVKPIIYIEKSVWISKYKINSRVARLRLKKRESRDKIGEKRAEKESLSCLYERGRQDRPEICLSWTS
jgi:hypothetical protein